MAIVITFRGFNDLGRSVTLIFLSMGRFLYRFSTFCEKAEENLSGRNFSYFCKTLHPIPFIRPLGLAVRQFQMPFLKIKVRKNDGNI